MISMSNSSCFLSFSLNYICFLQHSYTSSSGNLSLHMIKFESNSLCHSNARKETPRDTDIYSLYAFISQFLLLVNFLVFPHIVLKLIEAMDLFILLDFNISLIIIIILFSFPFVTFNFSYSFFDGIFSFSLFICQTLYPDCSLPLYSLPSVPSFKFPSPSSSLPLNQLLFHILSEKSNSPSVVN